MAKEFRIFFSWQSDLSYHKTSGFIKESIVEANNLLPDSISIILDEATRNLLGSPSIDHSIFEKIDKSDLFIADVSIVGTYPQDPNDDDPEIRYTPNPNVLLELGYASARLSWERCICLANTERGTISNLPFDLNHRRITDFTYDSKKGSTRKNKISQIADIINSTVITLGKREAYQKLSKLVDEQTICSISFPTWTKELEEEARICDENADRYEFYSEHLQKIKSILNDTWDILHDICEYPQLSDECKDLLDQLNIIDNKMDKIDFEQFHYLDPIAEENKISGGWMFYLPGSAEYKKKTKDWEDWEFSGKTAVHAVWKDTRRALEEDEYLEFKEIFDQYDAALATLRTNIRNIIG